jgi:hypothetical protein
MGSEERMRRTAQSTEPETFERLVKVKLEDANHNPIRIGSVLQHARDRTRGVVVEIAREGQRTTTPMISIGDIVVQSRPGIQRVTNQYSDWAHIPQHLQTYRERHLSWHVRPFEHEEDRDACRVEQLAIDGIMALLPEDTINWEYGPWPDRIDDALNFLVAHLSELAKQDDR